LRASSTASTITPAMLAPRIHSCQRLNCAEFSTLRASSSSTEMTRIAATAMKP
jgi:hypothetical protein